MDVIAVLNQKGGVAKTTTAHAIAAGLTNKGYSVLMVDLDGQRSLSLIAGASRSGLTTYDLLTGKGKAAQAIQHTESGDIIPAAAALWAADTTLTGKRREYGLKEALKPVAGKYGYCVVDCPPSLGILTINALTAADTCIIPAQADLLSLEAIDQLYQTIAAVRDHTNPALKIDGILITRYNGRAVLSREAVELIEDKAKEIRTKVYQSKIRESISLKEAQAFKQDIYSYSRRSNGAADYQAFIDEAFDKQGLNRTISEQ